MKARVLILAILICTIHHQSAFGATPADPAFDAFKATFAKDVAAGLKVLDEQLGKISNGLDEIIGSTAIASDPAFIEMTAADCESLKQNVVRASPINPFEIPLVGGSTRKIPFCEGLAENGYKGIKMGRLDKTVLNFLGVESTTTFGFVYTDEQKRQDVDTVYLDAIIYRLNSVGDIVEILSAKVVSRGPNEKFPSIELKMASRDATGGVYFFTIPETTFEALPRMTETYFSADPWVATVSREKTALEKKDVTFETVKADRPKVPANWMHQYLLLPAVFESYYANDGRYFTDDGMVYTDLTSAAETLVTKTLNGRDLCAHGYQVENGKVSASFPADTNNVRYCDRLP